MTGETYVRKGNPMRNFLPTAPVEANFAVRINIADKLAYLLLAPTQPRYKPKAFQMHKKRPGVISRS